MPFEQVVPPVTIIDEQVAYWPNNLRNTTIGGAFQSNGTLRQNFGATNLVFWLTGLGTDTMEYIDDMICGQLGTGAGGNHQNACGDELFWYMQPDMANLPASFVQPSMWRVYRMEWAMRFSGADITNVTGMCVQPWAGATPGSIVLGSPGFGITGDGLGGWNYINVGLGAFPGSILETVALPQALLSSTTWNQFQVEFINGSAGRNCVMSLSVNGTPVLSRNYVAGGVQQLVDPTAAGLLKNKIGWQYFTQGDLSFLQFTAMKISMGKFTASGLEITS